MIQPEVNRISRPATIARPYARAGQVPILTMVQAQTESLKDPAWQDAVVNCQLTREYSGQSFEECSNRRYAPEINKYLANHPGFQPIPPGYDDNWSNLTAMKVQREVGYLLQLKKSPIDYTPEKFGFNRNDFALTGYAGTRSMSDEVILQKARLLDRTLASKGYQIRIVGNPSERMDTLLTRLGQFFDRVQRQAQEYVNYQRSILSQSLVLASELFHGCDHCRSTFIDVSVEDTNAIGSILTSLLGTYRLDEPNGIKAYEKIIVPQKMGEGSLLAYFFFGNPAYAYIAFTDLGQFTVIGPYYANVAAQQRLPPLFINYLKRKGLVSQVAIELYPILRNIPIKVEDEWI